MSRNVIGEAFKFARQKRRLSARTLSLKAGLSASYVGKVESGEIQPSIKAFSKIAAVLGLTSREILYLIQMEAQDGDGGYVGEPDMVGVRDV